MTFGLGDITFCNVEEVHSSPEEEKMSWMTPKLQEVSCSMEVNMYFPAEDDTLLF